MITRTIAVAVAASMLAWACTDTYLYDQRRDVDVPAGAVALARKPITLQSLIDVIEHHSRGVDEAHR